MISLNKDMVITEVRTGVSVRRPIHDPSHLKVAEWIIEPGSHSRPMLTKQTR